MLIKKTLIVTMVILAASTFSCAIAKKCSDFSQVDYDRLTKGEKSFIGAKLEGANLCGRDLRGVDFRGAELEKANLQNADLSGADLTNADLEDANLKGAKISGTNFKGAELEFATWVDGRVCAEDSVGACW